MQVLVEAGEGLERRMKVELPFTQITIEVDKRLQQLARTAAFPGFRPGRAPMKVVRQRFIDRVQQDVIGELVQSSYHEALEQESLTPAEMPRIEPDIHFEDQRFAYTATFEIMPEFELASLADQSLKRPICELNDMDVDAVIERLRGQRKTWTPVERASQLGDQVLISFIGTLDGEPFEGGSGSDVTLELGSEQMIAGFEAGLIGAVNGEQRDLELTFPENYHAELAGKPVHFAVTVNAVMEPTLPILDEAFIQTFGIDDGDLARFRADVQANMERELKDRVKKLLKERVMDLLYAANSFALPSTLVKEEIADIAQNMSQKFDSQLVKTFPPELFEPQAKQRVALGFILGKIVSEHGLKVEANQIKARIEQMASTYDDPQAVLEYYYGKRERIKTVEAVLLEDAVVDWVMEQVQVEDEAFDFATLVNPEAA